MGVYDLSWGAVLYVGSNQSKGSCPLVVAKGGTQQKQLLMLFTDNPYRWESLTGRNTTIIFTR